MDELQKMLKGLDSKDILIPFFILFTLIIFMIWAFPKIRGNAYNDCLIEISEKNRYDVKSGILSINYVDRYYLSNLDYALCSVDNEVDYKKHVDEHGTRYPQRFAPE